MRTSTAMIGMILLAGSLGMAIAAETASQPGSVMTVQATPMTDAQIQQKLQSEGYSNLQITGHENNKIELTATKDGATQKLAVNPQTGASMEDKEDDD